MEKYRLGNIVYNLVKIKEDTVILNNNNMEFTETLEDFNKLYVKIEAEDKPITTMYKHFYLGRWDFIMESIGTTLTWREFYLKYHEELLDNEGFTEYIGSTEFKLNKQGE